MLEVLAVRWRCLTLIGRDYTCHATVWKWRNARWFGSYEQRKTTTESFRSIFWNLVRYLLKFSTLFKSDRVFLNFLAVLQLLRVSQYCLNLQWLEISGYRFQVDSGHGHEVSMYIQRQNCWEISNIQDIRGLSVSKERTELPRSPRACQTLWKVWRRWCLSRVLAEKSAAASSF